MYYYVRNILGEIIGIVDTSGNYVVKYVYNAWGYPEEITNGTGVDVSYDDAHIANINPFRYKGYYYDTETGFYYLQSRYYDPVTGRFVNSDGYVSTGTGFISSNMFAYCYNNPVMFIDSAGNRPVYLDVNGNGHYVDNDEFVDVIEHPRLPPPYMPVSGATLRKDYPYYENSSVSHRGTDIGAAEGTPVYAAMDGIVAKVSTEVNYNTSHLNDGSYGINIVIQLENGYTCRYAHLSKVFVTEGEHVSAGRWIANVGNTGNSFGAHLHYEINNEFGYPVSPFDYLPGVKK
jgi:RHS repeat-associated protein